MPISKINPSIFLLSILAMILVFVSSFLSIVADDGGNPWTFTSARGEEVEVYGGNGFYAHDTIAKALMFQGFNRVNMVIVLPLFALGIVLYKRGGIKGSLLLASLFVYLAYNYLIGAIGNAFNGLFLVWTVLFLLGIFGAFIVVSGMDTASILTGFKDNFPRKSISVYMFVLGSFLAISYMHEIISAYATGSPPVSLDHYTTLELAAFELGIMVPAQIIGGILLWKTKPSGYAIAIPLLFAAFMTFAALSVYSCLEFFQYKRGTSVDMLPAFTLAITSGVLSLFAFKRIKDE